MIWYYLILFVTTVLTAAFSWLPQVNTLPNILGIDIDTQLSQGMSMLYNFANSIWPIHDVLLGMIFLLGYYGIKMVLTFFLGHRAPH